MNKDLISVITCTGARQQAFSRLEYYMQRQTYAGKVQWIVVDDCEPSTEIKFSKKDWTVETYKGPKLWRPGINTQRYNMDEGFAHVKGEYLFVVEDDDWYAPDFLDAFMFLLKRYQIVGEGNSKYFNIETRSWREWNNWTRASLCQTGLHKSMYDMLMRAIHSGDLFFDIQLWRLAFREIRKPFLFAHQNYTVGMKGLPGRKGIGGGHGVNSDMQDFQKDLSFGKLREWIGDADAEWYIKLAIPDSTDTRTTPPGVPAGTRWRRQRNP